MTADSNFEWIKSINVIMKVKEYIGDKKGFYDKLGAKNPLTIRYYELREAIHKTKFSDLNSMSILYQINDHMDVCVKFIDSAEVGAK